MPKADPIADQQRLRDMFLMRGSRLSLKDAGAALNRSDAAMVKRYGSKRGMFEAAFSASAVEADSFVGDLARFDLPAQMDYLMDGLVRMLALASRAQSISGEAGWADEGAANAYYDRIMGPVSNALDRRIEFDNVGDAFKPLLFLCARGLAFKALLGEDLRDERELALGLCRRRYW